MGNIIWLIIMIPFSALFTGIGIFSWKRNKPMWFWSGSTVNENELSNVPAYNRANGIMWIAFSAVFWFSTVLGLVQRRAGGIGLIVGCIIGIPALPIAYGKIYAKYKRAK